METKKKKLSAQQKEAIQLLTNGKGLKYVEICKMLGLDENRVSKWMTCPEFQYFRDELAIVEKDRWDRLTDEALASASELIKNNNPKIVEYVLKCSGHNPVQKVEAEVNNTINLTIE